jgi:hypothetical protein
LEQILEKGELQVADRERESQLSNQFRDIATIVMDTTVTPETERPYTITMIERLMREVHFAVDPHRNSKQQVFTSFCLIFLITWAFKIVFTVSFVADEKQYLHYGFGGTGVIILDNRVSIFQINL